MRRTGLVVLATGGAMLAAGFIPPAILDIPHSAGIGLALRVGGIALALIGLMNVLARPQVPEASDFPAGTKFVIKEFDVPLALVPGKGWFNWYGGYPRKYDSGALRVDNNWPAESFEEWRAVVRASLKEGK